MRYDAVIIGGGAAGLFCAITAGRRGKRVAVVEHNAEVGRKIIISGGGRCNFTNLEVTSDNFVSKNPHFAKSALAGFTPADFTRLVSSHGIAFYEKKLGQLFCRGSSREIVEMLLTECRRARVEIRTNCNVAAVSKRTAGFEVITDQGELNSEQMVVACGGLSFPKVGATDLGYRIAKQFRLRIEPTRPSLVGLVLSGETIPDLAGISADALVSTAGKVFRENILFTHRGLSGPAILQISNYWQNGAPVVINMAADHDLVEMLKAARSTERSAGRVLSSRLPERVVERFIGTEMSKRKVNMLGEREINKLAGRLSNWPVMFSGTEGWHRAEVTLGGVSTRDLEARTLECKTVPGLYFIGEVVDVTGWLGGYNFQWAWSSGFAAGNAI